MYNPTETAFEDVFASVAITGEIISGELVMCNPLEQDKISILVYLSSLSTVAHGIFLALCRKMAHC